MWRFFEIVVTVMQMLIFIHFFYCFFGPRYYGKLNAAGFFGCWLAASMCTVAGNYLQGFGSIEVVGVPVIQLLYTEIFLDGKLRVKILIVTLATVITAGLAMGILWIYDLLFGEDINVLKQQAGIDRAVYVVGVNLIFFYITRMILFFKNRDWLIHVSDSGLLLAFPFITLVLLFVMEKLVRFPKVYTVEESEGVLVAFGLLACNFIIYYLFVRISKANMERIRLHYLQKQYEVQQENIEKVLYAEKEARRIRHDISNMLTAALGYIDRKEYESAKEYLLKIKKEQLNSSQVNAISNNIALNYIMAEKQKICDTENIKFSYTVLANKWFITDVDICILLGNLLDNAIEASKEVKKKEIGIYIIDSHDRLEIKADNTIKDSVLKGNIELKTSKQNKESHGIGIESIKNIVEKYHGIMDIYEKDERFCVSIILYPYC